MAAAHEVEGIGVRPIDDLRDKFLHLGSRLGLPIRKLAIEFFGDCRDGWTIDWAATPVNRG